MITNAPSASADLSSADEATAWRDAISLSPDDTSKIADRVVLLVVDATSTQWPVTVAAAALRRRGHAVCCRSCSIGDRDRAGCSG